MEKPPEGGSIHECLGWRIGGAYAFVTLPERMHEVQTRIFLLPFAVFAFTGRKLTFQRRFVTLCACEILLPDFGPLPQISHTCAMTVLQTFLSVPDWDPVAG
jgi:hypothetical protein